MFTTGESLFTLPQHYFGTLCTVFAICMFLLVVVDCLVVDHRDGIDPGFINNLDAKPLL